jgi:hypothetical protein
VASCRFVEIPEKTFRYKEKVVLVAERGIFMSGASLDLREMLQTWRSISFVFREPRES